MIRSPFFIIGTPRSGTTMLQMALNRHSQVVIPPETHFFSLLRRSRPGQLRHWERIQKALGVTVKPPESRIRAGGEAAFHFEGLIQAYCSLINKTPEFRGEKSPEHQLCVPEILATYPDARLILIFRDGRDVALSLSRAPWMPSSLEAGFLVWLHFYRIQKRLMEQYPQQIHCVRYESMVASPENELMAISHFLGLDYESEMAEGYGNRRGIRDDEFHKGRAVRKIEPSRIGTCRREVQEHRRQRLERWGGWALRELGYDLTTDVALPIPSLHLLWAYGLLTGEVVKRSLQCIADDVLGTSLYHANRPIAQETTPHTSTAGSGN